jgi:hypothetical protein
MSLEAWRSTRTDSFNAESGFPRGQNAVTSAQMVRCPNVAVWIRDTRLLAGGNHGAQYAREHVSSGLAQRNRRSCRGASARGFHHFAGQSCSFRRDCTHASRYVRVTSQASRGKRCGGGCVAGASGARELRLRLTNLFVSSATTPTRRRVGANTPPAPRPAPKSRARPLQLSPPQISHSRLKRSPCAS